MGRKFRSRYLNPITQAGAPLDLAIEYFDDFDCAGFLTNTTAEGKFSETADKGEWLVTIIDGATANAETIVVADSGQGGWLVITNNAADNDAVEMQKNGEAFVVTPGKDIIFETRMRIADVSETDWEIGLCNTDVTILAGHNDGIYFRCPDSTGDIDMVTEDDGTETVTDTTEDLADATFRVLRFELRYANDFTGSVKFYVDGEYQGQHTANLPDNAVYLTPTVSVRNDGAVAQAMTIDYLYAAQERV